LHSREIPKDFTARCAGLIRKECNYRNLGRYCRQSSRRSQKNRPTRMEIYLSSRPTCMKRHLSKRTIFLKRSYVYGEIPIKETYNYKKRPTYMRRDLCVCKKTYQRDLHVWKETCQSDLLFEKENYVYGIEHSKRLTSIQRDLLMNVYIYRCI